MWLHFVVELRKLPFKVRKVIFAGKFFTADPKCLLLTEANTSFQFNQVLMCAFRASCDSTRLSWAQTPVINWAVCLGQKVIS